MEDNHSTHCGCDICCPIPPGETYFVNADADPDDLFGPELPLHLWIDHGGEG